MGARDVQIRIVAFDQASTAFRQIEDAAARATRQMQNMGNNSSGAVYNAAGIAAGIMAYQALANAASAAMNMTLNFSKTMETNEIGIAGILMSMVNLNGKTMEWGDAINISKDTMSQLNDEALKTAASSEELVGAFRGLLAPGLAAKMNLKEIIELTSIGTNAVKSFNLPKTQILQELRDLVQGGIQPASSSLASAMGLKDADIKAAKESSEGLFKFLMKRMEGFKYSAEATQLTMSGMVDTALEGITRVGSVGTLPVFNMIKENLQFIGKQFVDINNDTGKVTISKDLTNELTALSVKTVKLANDLQELFLPVSEVAAPALKIAGAAVGLIADNVVTVGRGLAAWYVLTTIAGMYTSIAAVTSGAVVSNTLLGRAVAITTAEFSRQGATAGIAIAKEMTMVEGAAAAIIAAERSKAVAKKEAAMLAAGILKAEESGNYILSVQIRGLAAEYIRLGMTAEEAGLMQLQAANMAKKGNFLLAAQLIEVRAAHLATALAAREAQIASTVGAAGAMNAARNLGQTLLALAGGWVGVGIAAAWATSMAIDYLKSQNRVASYNAKAEVSRDKNGDLVKKFWDPNGRTISDGLGGEVVVGGAWGSKKLDAAELEQHGIEMERQEQESRDRDNNVRGQAPPTPVDTTDMTLKYPAAVNPDKKAAKLAEQIERHEDKLRLMIDGLNEKIIGETGTNFQSNAAKVLKEVDKMNIELREATEKGVNTDAASDKIKEYQSVMANKYERERVFANAELLNNTGVSISNTLNDKRSAAMYAKEKSYSEANKASIEEYKNVGGGTDEQQAAAKELVARSLLAKRTAADKAYTESLRDIDLQEIENRMQHNTILLQLEGKSTAEIDALNEKELRAKIARSDITLKYELSSNEDKVKAEQDKVNAIQAIQQTKLSTFDMEVQQNGILLKLGTNSNIVTDQLNKQALQSKITFLDTEIIKAGENKKEVIRLEQEKVSAVESMQQIAGRNMETAGAEAIRRIKAQQTDYADMMVSVYGDIETSMNNHLTSALNGTENFGKGVVGVFSDMLQSIEKMMMKSFIQKSFLDPLMGSLGGMFGGNSTPVGTVSPSLSQSLINKTMPAIPSFYVPGKAKGGRGQGLTLVGEEGPELINFDNPGMVYTAGQTKNMMGGNQSEPKITVNIANNSGQQVKSSQKATYDSDSQTTIISIVIDAIDRNVGGMRDAIHGGAG